MLLKWHRKVDWPSDKLDVSSGVVARLRLRQVRCSAAVNFAQLKRIDSLNGVQIKWQARHDRLGIEVIADEQFDGVDASHSENVLRHAWVAGADRVRISFIWPA